MEKRATLKAIFRPDGRSCQEIITDAQRLSDIRDKKQEAERLLRDAEEMRKKGLALLKEADAAQKKEKAIQSAIGEFIATDDDFIRENGEHAAVMRLREGEKGEKTFVVIQGTNSPKQYAVFFTI